MLTAAAPLLLGLALALISVIDARTRRIPDWLTLPLLAAGLLLGRQAGPDAFLASAVGAAAGYALLALFGAVFFRLRGQDGLGLGDAKLFGAAGAWLGWQALPQVLLVATLSGLAFAALTGEMRAGRSLAFGPWIALGFGGIYLLHLHPLR